jgi:hypothetical protein
VKIVVQVEGGVEGEGEGEREVEVVEWNGYPSTIIHYSLN